jgi:hypothetical protein
MHWHLDRQTGYLAGSFVVGSGGACEQSRGEAHATVSGRYALRWGTPECCNYVSSFRVTSSTLPFTGPSLPVEPAVALGLLMILIGLAFHRLGRIVEAPLQSGRRIPSLGASANR